VVTSGVLGDGIVHILIFFVLQLHRDDGQTIEEKPEIKPIVTPDNQLGNEGDPVFGIKNVGHALAGAGPGEIEFDITAAHAEAGADDRPQRAALQLLTQGLENFVAGVITIVLFQPH